MGSPIGDPWNFPPRRVGYRGRYGSERTGGGETISQALELVVDWRRDLDFARGQ